MARNLIVLLCTFMACVAGVMLPEAANWLAFAPAVSMLVQLLYCFLSTTDPATPLPLQSLKALPGFLVCKMLLVPLVCWAACRVAFPEYALGGLLVAAASIGVTGPFFAFLCGAEPFFVIGGVIASSFMLPLTMPLLAALVLAFDGRSVDGLMTACVGSALYLAGNMLVPFASAKLLWRRTAAAQWLMNRRFGITLVCIVAGNFVIFSRYSDPLLSNPGAVTDAFLTGLLTSAVMLGIGGFVTRRMPMDLALSRIIGFSCVNCALMVIVAAEFFSLEEVLVCALHTVILMSMGVPYAFCRRWLERRDARARSANIQ